MNIVILKVPRPASRNIFASNTNLASYYGLRISLNK